MISDPGRGWGWTRALLGVPARTVHVCGAPEALPLLQRLAQECGDDLQVWKLGVCGGVEVRGGALPGSQVTS